MQNLMANARIVLVNTSHPGNIGGVARAMKNMGIHNLVLVDPQEFPSGKADARSAGAPVPNSSAILATVFPWSRGATSPEEIVQMGRISRAVTYTVMSLNSS